MRFRPNRNFDRELQRQASYQARLAQAAEPAAEQAKQFAPVRTGDYRDSIKAVADAEGVRVQATDWKANWIEFGSIHNPVFAPLRKGVRAAGLRFKGGRR